MIYSSHRQWECEKGTYIGADDDESQGVAVSSLRSSDQTAEHMP